MPAPDGNGKKKELTLLEAVALWKGGQALSALKREYGPFVLQDGTKSPHLKTEITKLLGKDGFAEARAAGAGGRGFGHSAGVPRAPAEPPDDSKVPVQKGTLTKDGWTTRTLPATREDLLVAPDGVEYAKAKAHEHADLITKHKSGLTRWRFLEASAAGRKEQKKQKKEAKLLKHAAKAKEAKVKRKK
jgi:hypothetical protein